MKRIKHNNLLPWFTQDHGTLPASYLKSCEKFFKSIKQRGLTKKEERLGWITRGHEPQASSTKRQAASLKELDPTIDWNKLIDTLKPE